MDLNKAEAARNLLKVYEAAKARREGIELIRNFLQSQEMNVEDRIGYILNQVRDNKEVFYGFLEEMFTKWVDKAIEDANEEMKEARAELEAL